MTGASSGSAATLGILAGVAGALAVAAGAFGAHGLRNVVDAHALEVWDTAARYHLVHAVVLLVLATRAHPADRRVELAFAVLLSGVVIFSGSLYALVLSGQHWLGAVTPIGGVALMVGWLLAGSAIIRRGN